MKRSIFTFAFATIFIPLYAGEPPEADRKAILSMAGKFKVNFNFEETLPLQSGYELKKPYHEDAHEMVIVAEDAGDRIALQHLLVITGGRVIHHWRQVWTYEDTRINEFQGNNTWVVRKLSPEEARGTWSQLVTQVDNSPRYEGWGRWNHDGGAARWTSSTTWRPLPRREHTKRKDYDVLVGTNTHILTALGWAHEQANTKLDLDPAGSKAIARESGLNTYERIENFDFEPANKFWSNYGEFSNTVTAVWLDIMGSEDNYRIQDDIEVSELRDEIEALRKAKLPIAEAKEKIHAAILKYLRKAPATANR
jgi:hypothetical protein